MHHRLGMCVKTQMCKVFISIACFMGFFQNWKDKIDPLEIPAIRTLIEGVNINKCYTVQTKTTLFLHTICTYV
jgi:hypothetical protein